MIPRSLSTRLLASVSVLLVVFFAIDRVPRSNCFSVDWSTGSWTGAAELIGWHHQCHAGERIAGFQGSQIINESGFEGGMKRSGNKTKHLHRIKRDR